MCAESDPYRVPKTAISHLSPFTATRCSDYDDMPGLDWNENEPLPHVCGHEDSTTVLGPSGGYAASSRHRFDEHRRSGHREYEHALTHACEFTCVLEGCEHVASHVVE